MGSAEYRLEDRYLSRDGGVLLTGVQALARLPIEQLRRDAASGRRTAAFVSGYPGSPLGGYDMELDRALRLVPDLPVVHQPALNEELAATSIMGTQLVPGRADATVDGVTGYWYGKAPGVDRASDALRHAVFSGTAPTGGAVALVGDDPQSKSSTLPTNAGSTILALGMPLLYPGTVGECLELGLHAVEMSRVSGMWVGMKIITPVADGSATLEVESFGVSTVAPVHTVNGEIWRCRPTGHLLGTAMVDIEREIHEIRLPLVRRYGTMNGLNRVTVAPADAWIGIVASGYTYHQVRHALARLGLDSDTAVADAGIRLLNLRMPVPFDVEVVRAFADGLDEIVVISDKDDPTDMRVRDALYGRAHAPRVVGNDARDGGPVVPTWGLVTSQAIEPVLRARLSPRLGDRLVPDARPREKVLIPLTEARTPFFCSGCPHNWSTLVPEGAEVGAGIGCSTMVLLMDEERVGRSIGDTAMGNEGAQWTGMSHFVEADHLFQNLGDGTYFHSGQLAIQHAVAAGAHMTFKLLVNGTVAMTGGQTAQGERGLADITRSLLAQGVTKVAITTDEPQRVRRLGLPYGVDVHDRHDIVRLQERLREEPGVTVLIHDQACAAEARRRRRRGLQATPTFRVVINHRVCEGCGDCGQVSNCLSVQPVETPYGRKTAIDQASCNLDLSCLGGDCPAFMTVEVDRAPRADGSDDVAPEPALPEPPASTPDTFRIRLTGIGGTGVVTAAQVLATAAMLDGYTCRGIDQTGLSQKAGPVVSDLVLSRGTPIEANTIGPGEADVIIAFDALVGASDGPLDVAHPDRTRVVASLHRTPTGSMVAHPERVYPDDATLIGRFAAVSRPAENVFLDAFTLATSQSGSGAHANTVLVGAAVQSGALPISPAAIEQGIRLNGVEVARNLHALAVGRRWVVDPDAFASTAAPGASATGSRLGRATLERIGAIGLPDELARLVTMLADDLVGFQDRRCAERFVADVEVAAAHDRRVNGVPGALTETVARNLHKVTAYKDEYEVARLMLAPEVRPDIERIGGRRARFRWHLHPPLLRSLGRNDKIAFSSRTAPLMRVLASGKRLRGSFLDPFGHTHHRRRERELSRSYRTTLDELYGLLRADTYDEVVGAVDLVDQVRGYGELKDRRLDAYHSAMAEALDGLRHRSVGTPVAGQ